MAFWRSLFSALHIGSNVTNWPHGATADYPERSHVRIVRAMRQTNLDTAKTKNFISKLHKESSALGGLELLGRTTGGRFRMGFFAHVVPQVRVTCALYDKRKRAEIEELYARCSDVWAYVPFVSSKFDSDVDGRLPESVDIILKIFFLAPPLPAFSVFWEIHPLWHNIYFFIVGPHLHFFLYRR